MARLCEKNGQPIYDMGKRGGIDGPGTTMLLTAFQRLHSKGNRVACH